jgi:hypothetical protein
MFVSKLVSLPARCTYVFSVPYSGIIFSLRMTYVYTRIIVFVVYLTLVHLDSKLF